jgi:hypothetical protein
MFPPAPPTLPLGGPPPPTGPLPPVPPPQPPPAPETPQQNLPMTGDEVREWWARIELDRQRRKRESTQWRRLFKAYMPPTHGGDLIDINSNIHFRDAHLKIAEVWAQLPELILTPLEPLQGLPGPPPPQPPPPQPGQPPAPPQPPPPPPDPDAIVAIKRAVLNKMLGRDGANVDLTMEQTLFDVFATSGVGATKICYQADISEIPQEQPAPPVAQPGAILGLQDMPGGTQPGTVPVVVNERYLWYRFSAEKLLIPSDFHSTDFDNAPYLAMEFSETLTPQALKKYNLPPDFQPNASRDEKIISRDNDLTDQGRKKLLTGVEIWLYACYFDPTVAHTQVMRRLVLIDGQKDRPAIYTLSPYQSLDAQGKLTYDSMIGNPIHPFVLRVASDTAWVPCDAAFTDPLVRIENTWMSQDVKMRDANVPRFLHSDKITAAIDKLKNMDTGQGAAVADQLMTQGIGRLIAPIPHLEHAQADAIGREQNQAAISETLGISPNQAGSYTRSARSATEVATVQANVSVRLKKEQNNLLMRFLAGVSKFDSLIQRYMTEPGYVQVVGTSGNTTLQPFTQAHLSGRYAYDARPDSQLTIDQTSKIKQYTDFVNFMAKSNFLNMKNIARIGANTFGFDPALVIQDPPPPPPPQPPPVNVSVALKAADLGLPEVNQLLASRGVQLSILPSPQLQLAMAQEYAAKPPHGGAADKVDLVEKHSSEQTGNQPGQPPLAGQPAQGQPPGHPLGQTVQ